MGSLPGFACKVLGTIGEGWWGKACNAVASVGGKLGKVGKAVKKVASNGLVQRGVAIAAIVAWVLGGAKWTMNHMASVISSTTSPRLTAGWFTGVYLRVEALALFFTLLFLCAAAVEALLRSDGAILAKAAFGYLPLAAVLTAVATPLTLLVLATTDQISAGFVAIAGQGATHFATGTSAWVVTGLAAVDPFFAVMAGALVVAAGGALWVEMLVREVSVYVVVAMMPLAFAAMVWPARRIWAVRTVEVLVALILSKVAIVVVLALGGAALGHSGASGLTKLLGGLALVLLGAFSPWILLRLIPLAEVASAAVGHVRGHVHASFGLPTPEAAVGSKVADAVGSSRRNGSRVAPDGAFVGGDGAMSVQELLGHMHRRASVVERNGHDSNDPGAAAGHERKTSDSSRGTAPPSAGVARDWQSAPEGSAETMVQQPDGSWEPLRHSEPQAPISPPPWEQREQRSNDATAEPAPPPPSPGPQEGWLAREEEEPSD